MTPLVKSIGDFINTMIQTFNLSVIFPSVIFIVLFQYFIIPTIPDNSHIVITLKLIDKGSLAGLGIISIIFLSYILDASNFVIIRFYEGYYFTNQFPFYFIRPGFKFQVQQKNLRIND